MARRHKRAKFLKKNVVVPEVRKMAQPRKMKKYKDSATDPGQSPLPLEKEEMKAPSRRMAPDRPLTPPRERLQYEPPKDIDKMLRTKKKKMYGGKKGKKKKSEFDKLYGDWV